MRAVCRIEFAITSEAPEALHAANNYGDPITGQTGRLFLPFDVRIGRELSDNAALSFELGVPIVKDYPVYNLKTQVRLNVTY